MFFALHFIQVGCQAEEYFTTVSGHFHCLSIILICTFFNVNLPKKAMNQQKESQHHI